MTKHTRHPLRTPTETPQDMYAKVEQELAEGYVEVEITGMTFRRLVCVYTVLLRGAWAHTLATIRSFFHIDPAAQA